MKNTKALIFLLVMLGGIGLAGYGILSLLEAIDNGDPTVPLVLTAAGIIVAVIFGKLRERASRSYCPKCGYHYDFEDDVAYEEDGRRTTSGNNAKALVKLKFTCRCQECGHEIHWKKEFVMAEVKGSNVVDRDVEGDIKKFFM